jgi:hypothetical protein
MKNILNFETVQDFTSAYTGNPDAIPTPVPGVAYVRENGKVKYNQKLITVEPGYVDFGDEFYSFGSGFTVEENWDGVIDPSLNQRMEVSINEITDCESNPNFCGYGYFACTDLEYLFAPGYDLIIEDTSGKRIDMSRAVNAETIYYVVFATYCK